MVSGMPLQIAVASGQPLDVSADVVVVGVWTFGATKKVPPGVQVLDAALGGGLLALLAKEEFTGKRDQILSVPTLGKAKASRFVVIGLGDRAAAKDPEG